MKNDNMQFESYSYKIELHAHSKPVSRCSEIVPERMIEAYSELGANAIVLTNHFYPDYFLRGEKAEMLDLYLKDYSDLKDLGKKCNINVILGMEIRFSENVNDYLLYGIDEDDVIKCADLLEVGIDNFYKIFKNERNVIIQAHPMRKGMVLANPKSLDGVEVFNMHPGHNASIGLVSKYASEHNFLVTGGTDFHHEGHQGCCFMKSKTLPENSFDVAKIIKEKDFVFDVFGNIIVPYNYE